MLVMALDVGTSSTRAVCFDADARPVSGAEASSPYEPITTPDGGVELDPDALLQAVTAAVDGCLAAAGRRAREVHSIGVSVFWHGLLGLDAGGTPVTRVITWADTRSANAARDLRRLLDEEAVHAKTGAPLHSTFFPAKLRWLRTTRPDTFARARTWCGFAEYLSARLNRSSNTSLSMASGTGLMNQATGRWDDALLEISEIEPGQLPVIDDAPAAGLAPSFASRWPDLARARWHPARGDGACSNLGSDCGGPDRVALNVGTSSAMRVVTLEALGTTPCPTPWGLWRYRVDDQRSLVGGATSEGGNVHAWCRRVLALPLDDDALERAIAEIPAGAQGLAALPFLAGERSVGWRGDARGVLDGISLHTSAAGIARAFMEGVACRLALVYARLAPLAAPGHAVVSSGGALARSPVWTGIVADALGVPLTVSSAREASARGAALLALAAEGAPAPPSLPVGRAIAPDQRRHEIYRALAERQQRLYDNVVGPRLS